jgi:hypothetical protein
MALKKRGKSEDATAPTSAVTVPPELGKWPRHVAKHDPTEAFRQLQDTNPEVRRVGAKWIAKQAHGAVNNFTEYWLKDPSTMDRLLPLLNDPDPQRRLDGFAVYLRYAHSIRGEHVPGHQSQQRFWAQGHPPGGVRAYRFAWVDRAAKEPAISRVANYAGCLRRR